ncbi:Indole-3-glycerol phosphate synthase, chloroplastic [Morella rubra]|uniref:indole-3-glycerol-phosphate synthase n=1 Tax=Morella rubra TaxID=262757 RepID=A0A6A1V8E8_9ROSI|nr:Indole-3-glycerol phosphate synthase, chloroplastic [Morella rubra]
MLLAIIYQLRERRPLSALMKNLDNVPPTRDFIGALRAANLRTGLPGLIAEVKKASPSRGVLREDFDPVEIAQAYERGGAACLSVLTDEKYFKGSFENLELIRNAGVKCPLLCKEFIVDAWQIYNARVKGADAILLIAAVLPDLDIKYMSKICKILGMAVLVEVHNERELDRVLGIDGIELVGINNRNLETFEVDISNTKKLLEGERGQRIREKDIIVVGESGLFTPDDIAFVKEAGVRAGTKLGPRGRFHNCSLVFMVHYHEVSNFYQKRSRTTKKGKSMMSIRIEMFVFLVSFFKLDRRQGNDRRQMEGRNRNRGVRFAYSRNFRLFRYSLRFVEKYTHVAEQIDFGRKAEGDDAWYSATVELDGDVLRLKYCDSPKSTTNSQSGDFKSLSEIELFEDRFRPASVQAQDSECSKCSKGTSSALPLHSKTTTSASMMPG